MPTCSQRSVATLAVFAALALSAGSSQAQKIGIFDGQQDVGTALHAGSAEFDSAHNTYSVTGSGENMWFSEDDFNYVWKKVSGDVALTADIDLIGTTGNTHRKGVLMIRKSMDKDSVSSDLAVHGDGLTSLQFRDTAGGNMAEVQTNVSGPRRVRIEKRGDFIYAFVPGPDGKLHPSGAATKLPITGEFYIGMGVCAHDKDAIQKVVFSNVSFEQLPPPSGKMVLLSTLEAVPVSGDRRVQYSAVAHFEAPNWTRDGKAFIFNQDGLIRRLELGSAQPTIIPTEPLNKCNNDHGISPDGVWLAVSSQSGEEQSSRVYLVPIAGGTPRLVTKNGGSYWHGWSPDGKTLAFAARRGTDAPIFTISLDGSNETRLTTAPGHDDGPEYSPDGAYIYFNSDRTGPMQIWRMKPDGSAQEQVLFSDSNDWFPHISPDGQWMVYLSYSKDVTGHPPNKDVELHLMSVKDKKITVLAKFFGGQGTINVPSWSPDSKKIAFVSYALLPEDVLTAK
jgi:hypothetical protein